jgi:hypothetical protein
LANAVIAACAAAKAEGSPFRFLYPLELSLKEKIETICREMYGADGVDYTDMAEQRLAVSFQSFICRLSADHECLHEGIHCIWIRRLTYMHSKNTILFKY